MGLYINPVEPGLIKVARVAHVTNWREQFDADGNEVKGQLTPFPPFDSFQLEEGEVLFALFHNGQYPVCPAILDERDYLRWQDIALGDGPNMLISDILILPSGTKYGI